MIKKKVVFLIGSFTAAAALAACSSADSQAAAPAQPSAAVVKRIELSRAKSYTGLDQLAKDSTVVARVKATGVKSVETVNGIQFTITTVKVAKAFRGTTTGAELQVRQVGGPTIDVSGEVPDLLSADTDYLLFLNAFRNPGIVAGQYVITGDAGMFRTHGSGTFERSDPLSTQLPTNIGEGAVASAAAVS